MKKAMFILLIGLCAMLSGCYLWFPPPGPGPHGGPHPRPHQGPHPAPRHHPAPGPRVIVVP